MYWAKKYYPPGNHHAIATSKNVLFPGHNHLLTTGTDDLILIIREGDHQHQWSAGGYGYRTYLEVDSMVVIWWIVAFLCGVN